MINLAGSLSLSPLCGELLGSCLDVSDSDDEVLNGFLHHTLSLCCLNDAETLVGSSSELTPHQWTMTLPGLSSKLLLYPWENTKSDRNKGQGAQWWHNTTLTEIMINSFVTGTLNIVASVSTTLTTQLFICCEGQLKTFNGTVRRLSSSAEGLLTLPLSVTAGVICQMGPS